MRTSNTEGGLRILHQDADVLAVLKPAGMPSQPDPTGDPDVAAVLQEQVGGEVLQVAHRLDRPVQGVLLLGRTASGLRGLNEAFAQGMVRKCYLALVEGHPPPPATEAWSVLEHHLQRDGRNRKAVRSQGSGDALRLRYRCRAMGDRLSLLEVMPEGGAFHQIRAQLAAAGMPIRGDVKYGARRGLPDRSIGLFAWTVELDHPVTGDPLRVQAPFPQQAPWPAMLALAGLQ